MKRKIFKQETVTKVLVVTCINSFESHKRVDREEKEEMKEINTALTGSGGKYGKGVITGDSTEAIFAIMPSTRVIYKQRARAGNTCFENILSLTVK